MQTWSATHCFTSYTPVTARAEQGQSHGRELSASLSRGGRDPPELSPLPLKVHKQTAGNQGRAGPPVQTPRDAGVPSSNLQPHQIPNSGCDVVRKNVKSVCKFLIYSFLWPFWEFLLGYTKHLTFSTIIEVLIWLRMLRIYFIHFFQPVSNSLGWISGTCPKVR